MKVRDIMPKKIIKIKSGSTLAETAKVLIQNKISGAPVVDKAGKLIGVISEKDIFSALYPNINDIIFDISAWFDNEKREYKLEAKKEIIINSIMTKKVITIKAGQSVLEAGNKMIANQIHRLIVKNDKNQMSGIITRRDVFHKIIQKDLKIK